jgi:hypothetical protein
MNFMVLDREYGQKCIVSGGEIKWERNNLEDPVVDGRIILKCILNKCDRMAWSGLIADLYGSG